MDSIELWQRRPGLAPEPSESRFDKEERDPELAVDALRKLPGSVRTIPGAKHRFAARQMTLVAQGTS
jgi:hypothetical protein